MKTNYYKIGSIIISLIALGRMVKNKNIMLKLSMYFLGGHK